MVPTVQTSESLEKRERILGCLLAGVATEADWTAELQPTSSVASIRNQLTMVIFEGMLRAQQRWFDNGLCHGPTVLWHALARWGLLHGHGPPANDEWLETGWLREQECVRAPARGGYRTRQALDTCTHQDGIPARNSSRSSGCLVRIAPIAFWFSGDVMVEVTTEHVQMTHGHRDAALAACVYLELLHGQLGGQEQDVALDAALLLATRQGPAGQQLADRIRRVVAGDDVRGSGQSAPSALCHAVVGARESKGVHEAAANVERSCTRPGNARFLAAQLAGARQGRAAVPTVSVASAQVAEVMRELVDDYFLVMASSSFHNAGLRPSHLPGRYPPN